MCESEAEQFSLRWNNFHTNLSSGFHALLQEEDLVDVTLAADGQFVQAHKIVLSVCSPYFKQLFKVAACKHPIVILKDVCHKELVAILQFMYQGEVNVRQEELAAFLKTAEMLQIKGLTGDDSPATSTPSVPNATPDSALLEPLVVQSEEPPARQYKRMRTEPRPVSPKENSTRDIEYVQVAKPKEEPTEYGSDVEEVDTNVVTVTRQTVSGASSASVGVGTKREDPIVQLLGTGESSSHSLQETPPQGTSLFTAIPGLSQDSGGSQDGGGQVGILPGDSEDVACHICGRVLRKTSLRRHIVDKHFPTQQTPCQICGKIFRTANSLATHMNAFHKHEKLKSAASNRRIEFDSLSQQ